MKLVIGLGNPGKKYAKTRHNVGFLVLDKIVTSDKITPQQSSGQASNKEWQLSKNANAEYIKIDNKVELLKPQTFMNLSGKAVQYAMQKHEIKLEDIIVICDDLDLPLGTVRIRMEGSSGGHNGLQSVIDHVGNKFTRIRVGIGSNKLVTSDKVTSNMEEKDLTKKYIPAEEYVLQNFTKDEANIVSKSVDKTAEILLEWINGEELSEQTVKLT